MIKRVNETVKNEVKEQKGRFPATLMAILGTNLMEKLVASKRIIRPGTLIIKAKEA